MIHLYLRANVRTAFVWASALAAAAASTAVAAPVSSVASGVYSAGTTWSDGQPPAAGNTYEIASGFTVASVSGTAVNGTVLTFAGDGLSVLPGGTFNFSNSNAATVTNTFTVPAFRLAGGRLVNTETNGTGYDVLNGPVEVTAPSTITFAGGNFTNELILSKGLTGGGNLDLTLGGGGTGSRTSLLIAAGSAPAYSGDVAITNTRAQPSVKTVGVSGANALGTGNITVGAYSLLNNGLVYTTGSPTGTATGASSGLDGIASLSVSGTSSQLTLSSALNNPAGALSLASAATLNLGTGTSVIGTLTLDGSGVPTGTYTTADLAALDANLTFGGTGTISVLVPEPSSVAALAVAAGLLARRRPRRR